MLPRMDMHLTVRRYVKRRQVSLSNLKFQNRRAKPSTTISKQRIRCRVIFYSPATEVNDRCLTTRQYARLVSEWIALVGLDPSLFGTHSIRRTKATLIYRKTGNLRAVQLLLGHTKVESTVRYLGIEVDDALAIAEQVDV